MRNYQVQGNLFKQESRLCEFLVILSLPRKIEHQVKVYKEEFEVLFGDYNSRHSIPHITICDFLLFEHRTYDIFTLFKSRLEELSPFRIHINGFASFAESRTLYLNVEKTSEYDQLLTEVNLTRQLLRLRKNYFQSNTPHITIAKNLSPDVFRKGKDVFLKRDFVAEYEADSLEVLKFDLVTRRYHHFGSLPLKGH